MKNETNQKDNSPKCWGGKRLCAGRKKTCSKKISITKRINQNILNILKKFAQEHEITVTEALENAILLQANTEILKGGKIMKIAIPSKNEKLCGHFGKCEAFTFAEIDLDKKEILSIENKVPEEGISCQSASWIAEQGANIVLAGGMGMRPMNIFAQSGVKVMAGCPELSIKELLNSYMKGELSTGVNACAEGSHHCNGHHEHHGCSH